jgi:hypothetical protein
LAETCTDSPSNIWIENSSRNSNKSLLGRNYFSMRFKGAESRLNSLARRTLSRYALFNAYKSLIFRRRLIRILTG